MEQHKHMEEWVSTYSDEMYNWAYYKTSQRELAEDLVQETFLSAYKAFDKFKRESNPKTWLFTILNNKIIDHYRSAVHRKLVNETQLGQEDSSLFDENDAWQSSSVSSWDQEPHLLDTAAFNKVLEKCLDHLPEKHKAVTMAKFFHHKKGADICKELEITPSNLWQMVHRAKLQLKKCIDSNWTNE